MSAAAVLESMITWSGTRHKVGERHEHIHGRFKTVVWFSAACNEGYRMDAEDQIRPHKRDCKRCFPPAVFPSLDTFREAFGAAPDFGSDTLTDLERLQAAIQAVVGLCTERENATAATPEWADHRAAGRLADELTTVTTRQIRQAISAVLHPAIGGAP